MSTDHLRPCFYTINGVVYAIQVTLLAPLYEFEYNRKEYIHLRLGVLV